jgi:hypothetical protein
MDEGCGTMNKSKHYIWVVVILFLSENSFSDCNVVDLLEVEKRYLTEDHFKESDKFFSIRYFGAPLLFPNRFLLSSNPRVKGRFTLGADHEAQDRFFNCDIQSYLSEVITFGLVEECSECKLAESTDQWSYERLTLTTSRDTLYSQRFKFSWGPTIGFIFDSEFYIRFETPSRGLQGFIEQQLETHFDGTFEGGIQKIEQIEGG